MEEDFKGDIEEMKPGTKKADFYIALTQNLKTGKTKCCSGINT